MRKLTDFSTKYFISIIHIVFWLCFLIIPFLFTNTPYNDHVFLLKLLINTFVLALFFYTNTQLLIPKLLGRKKVQYYILAIVLITSFIVGVKILLEYYFNPDMFQRDWFLGKIITDSVFSALIVLTIGGGLKITREWFKNERLKKEIESEKLIAELALMKSQVNPHFLFNTLNNIRSLVRKNSPNSDAAIIKLSQLMRYMLYDASSDLVPLEKEIEYLQNFIDLQKLRLPEKVDIGFDIEEEVKGHYIQPMLFIPFVENAFKHGVSYVEESKVFIKLKVMEHSLHFSIYNNMNVRSEDQKKGTQVAGFGLKNIRKRLEILYPGRHTLDIKSENGTYAVDLEIEKL